MILEDEIGKILIAESDIKAKVNELAARISRDYAGKEILLVGILKGAFMFMADLCRAITVPVKFDFIAVSSYGSGTKSCGVVRILKDLDMDIRNSHVLIVEDIVDSGLTLNYLYRNLHARGPASMEVCALLRKPEGIKGSPDVKYLGFDIPSEFVVGYGLDYAEKYRNLNDIAVLRR